MRRSGGRRTARYAQNATVDGKLAERRFDLNPSPPPYRPSPQEAAAEAFGLLNQQDQDQLTGWAVASISKAIPRSPWDGSPKTGLLSASALAQEATQDLNRTVTAAQIAGACLYLGFATVTSGNSPAELKLAADWKAA